jgi:hypothetical protein
MTIASPVKKTLVPLYNLRFFLYGPLKKGALRFERLTSALGPMSAGETGRLVGWGWGGCSVVFWNAESRIRSWPAGWKKLNQGVRVISMLPTMSACPWRIDEI